MKERTTYHWRESSLGEILVFEEKSDLQAGAGRERGRYKFFTSSDTQSKFIDEAVFEGEHLILSSGGQAGVHYCNEPFSASTDCFVAAVDSRLDTKYVYYFLLTNIRILEAGFRGSGLHHISKKYIERIRIPYPEDRLQQRDIVARLDKLQTTKVMRNEANELSQRFLKAVFLDAFGDPILNRMKWQTRRLEEVASISRGRFTPRPRNDPRYFGGKYPFIQTGDISNANHRLSKYTQTLNDDGAKVSKKFNEGTVVIAIVGATIGETAVLRIDTYATDSVIGIVPNASFLTPEYLEMALTFWKPIFKLQAPEFARANINNETLKSVEIPLPPIQLQGKFTDVARNVEKTMELQSQSARGLNDLLGSATGTAFRGN